ncbi:hypothetical protein ASA1KI_24550 [Opitutales bacterium ASA1]|nr:hypothetical protein ASA1KI_24550 [Opitutales bacterium ASA1]
MKVFTIACTSLVVLSRAPAQTTPSTPPGGTAPGENEVVVLSPFEVNSSSDVGYQATESLAGTRIRTNLRDVGSAISVATEEFMRDVGATNSETLLQYMVSTEVGGSQGNFLVGSSIGDASVLDDTAARVRPQSNTRVRGLDSADNTRDFFLTDIPWDGYNTSRIDIQRGANSILFGNGSGAGIINGAPDSASFGRDHVTVSARTDDQGSARFSLNLNRVLIDDELAVRFAALRDNKKYQQDPAYNRDERVYGALRWEPKFLKRGGARTTVRVSYEDGKIDANRPRMNTINDSVSPWFITSPVELRSPTPLGRPAGQDDTLLGVMYPMKSKQGYSPFVVGINNATLISGNPGRTDIGARAATSASNPNSEAWIGALVRTNLVGGSTLFPGIDGGGLNYWTVVYDDPNSNQVSRIIQPGIINYPTINSAGVRDGAGLTGLRGPETIGLLRLEQYATRGLGSFLYALQGLWRSRTLTDPSFFDFYNKLIDGPNKAEGSRFSAFNASVEQSFWRDRIGFQLAFDRQEYSDYRRAVLGNPTIRMDIYSELPYALLNPTTGLFEPAANPNFGRPYVISRPSAARSVTEREVVRVTPYAELDFPDLFDRKNIFTRILGKHTITGLAEETTREQSGYGWTRFALGDSLGEYLAGPNQGISDTSRLVGTSVYLGPSIATAPSMAGANLSNIGARLQPALDGAGQANAWYFDGHYTATVSPSDTITPPALGLAPNAVGGTSLAQAENPLNYAGWGTAPRAIDIWTDDVIGEQNLATNAYLTRDVTTSFAIVDQWRLLDDHVVVTAGLRKDKIETYYPGDPSLPANDPGRTGNRPVFTTTTDVVNWDAPFEFPDDPSYSYTSEWMKTYGAVIHLPDFIRRRTPFGLRTSLIFNRSENFRPENRIDPITGEQLAPPTGETEEYGIAFSNPEKRFSVKLNWYETRVTNASLPDNGVINFAADEFLRSYRDALAILYVNDRNRGTNESGGNPSLETGTPPSSGVGGTWYFRPTEQTSNTSLDLDPANPHVYPYQPERAPTAENPWTLQDWINAEDHAIAAARAMITSTQNDRARQYMATWNIGSDFNWSAANWGITATGPRGTRVTGDTLSKGTEIELFFSPLRNWDITMNMAKTFATRRNLAGNMASWLQERWALYNETYTGAESGLLIGSLRWFGHGNGAINDAYARFGRNGYRFYSEFYSREGVNVADMRPYRFNIVTNYRFTEGRFKGTAVGMSYRWEDRSVIGYGVTETTPELFSPDGNRSLSAAVGALDINKPFYSDYESHVGAWISYSRRIFNDVDWRIQLNVNNIGEKDRVLPVTVNPDGSGAAYRIAYGSSWNLSSTFKF